MTLSDTQWHSRHTHVKLDGTDLQMSQVLEPTHTGSPGSIKIGVDCSQPLVTSATKHQTGKTGKDGSEAAGILHSLLRSSEGSPFCYHQKNVEQHRVTHNNCFQWTFSVRDKDCTE